MQVSKLSAPHFSVFKDEKVIYFYKKTHRETMEMLRNAIGRKRVRLCVAVNSERRNVTQIVTCGSKFQKSTINLGRERF